MGGERSRLWSAAEILERDLEGPQYARWRALRGSEDARYLGLCLPRLLLRLPYRANTRSAESFAFEEDVVGHQERYLWGNAALALATRVADSFAKYRWCPHIICQRDLTGYVAWIPQHRPNGWGPRDDHDAGPTEALLSDRQSFYFEEKGFIVLQFSYTEDHARFCSAHSVKRREPLDHDSNNCGTETGDYVGMELPYLFMIARFAHYLKVIARDAAMRGGDRGQIERLLVEWLNGHSADLEDPRPRLARRIWSWARVSFSASNEHAPLCPFELKLRPHWTFMGRSFLLSLSGVLDLGQPGSRS